MRKPTSQDTLVLRATLTLHARMQEQQRLTGANYRDQVLDAIEATHTDLPDLLAKVTAPVVQGSLFERLQTTAPDAEAKVQVTVRNFLPTQMAVIDQLVAQAGSSRTELVTTALNHHLPEYPADAATSSSRSKK